MSINNTADVNRITVITLTRNRTEQLRRAIRCVSSQMVAAKIEHIVLIDDCIKTHTMIASMANLNHGVRWSFHPRKLNERSGPPRVAHLRNLGVRMATGASIAFLDDDNEWEPHHLSTLIECMRRTRCPAVHSHLTLYWPDGRQYVESKLPWSRNAEEAATEYAELVCQGVFEPGSNVVRDRADPLGHPDPVRTVDMGAWLFARQLLERFAFTTEYDIGDWKELVTEDDKLLRELIAHRVPIACTEQATLKYYLGGYSNTFHEAADAWEIDAGRKLA